MNADKKAPVLMHTGHKFTGKMKAAAQTQPRAGAGRRRSKYEPHNSEKEARRICMSEHIGFYP